MTKYVFVTGGVVSGLGKGITAASLGRLMKARGYKVTLQKFDPYINVDPSLISPYQHGEVFVTNDGAEVDLDLGHYERFIDEDLSIDNDITTGQIYSRVIQKERQGYYNGGTVQVVPHITNEIKDMIYKVGKAGETDLVITEIGGTVGDIESHPFLEAIRQFANEVGKSNVAFVHVTLVPYIKMSGEQKTKPTQHSVKELLNVGIQPDLIVCRSEKKLDVDSIFKLALFCNIDKDCVIQNLDASSLFEVPLLLEKEGFGSAICRKLGLENRTPDLSKWQELSAKIKELEKSKTPLKIAVVGKYVKMYDAYLSLCEALKHGANSNDVKLSIDLISSESINEENVATKLQGYSGIVVPAGFGYRGFEGKVTTCKYARTNNIPMLGIGMGMQASIVEFARNVCYVSGANTTELDEESNEITIDPIIHKSAPEATCFRLGTYPCKLEDNTRAKAIYNDTVIYERHRNKREVNDDYREMLKTRGLTISGVSTDGKYVEIVELTDKKFYIGVLFHPEYKSRPTNPHPLFKAFVEACKQ